MFDTSGFHTKTLSELRPSRRQWLQGSALLAAALAVGKPASAAPTPIPSKARIVIIGAGAAGLSMAAQLRQRLDGAEITIVDSKRQHWYQPGFTLVAGGIWDKSKVVADNRDLMTGGVRWVEAMAAEFDPDANRVVTDKGETLTYDYLVVASGLQLNYGKIEGMSTDLIGRDGIASVYAGPEGAAATAAVLAKFTETGGVALHGRPATEMKCAGAPLKLTFLTHARLNRAGTRSKAEIVYNAHNNAVFAVAPVHEKVTALYKEKGIKVNYGHLLVGVDPGRKRAIYRTANGNVELAYDFLHVVPPMSAPDAVRNSKLAWQNGPFAADGWIEVDEGTLLHKRYANVCAVGDVAGVRRGKTAASVKHQVPVAAENLVSVIAGKPPTARYNGYTSCPLITDIGSAMLVEFDYEGRLTPSFPFIDPLREHWAPWVMKDQLLSPIYFAMVKGRF